METLVALRQGKHYRQPGQPFLSPFRRFFLTGQSGSDPGPVQSGPCLRPVDRPGAGPGHLLRRRRHLPLSGPARPPRAGDGDIPGGCCRREGICRSQSNYQRNLPGG